MCYFFPFHKVITGSLWGQCRLTHSEGHSGHVVGHVVGHWSLRALNMHVGDWVGKASDL